MKVGDLVKLTGNPRFYGILLKRVESTFPGKWWNVLWMNGSMFVRSEALMEVIGESR